MSIWLHAFAGGLQGVGASMTRQAEHERQMRGLALREAYINKRQEAAQTFRADESEKSRTFQADQREADRTLRTNLHAESQASAERRHTESQTAATGRHKELVGLRREKLQQDADQFTELQKLRTKEAEDRANIMKKRLDAAAKSAKLESDENRREFLSTIYKAPNPDPSMGDKPVVDIHKVTVADNLYQKTGRFPWQTRVTSELLLADVKAQGKGLDEVVQWLIDHKFDVPMAAVNRARSVLDRQQRTSQQTTRTASTQPQPQGPRPLMRVYQPGALP